MSLSDDVAALLPPGGVATLGLAPGAQARPVDYPIGSPATASLLRLHGVDDAGWPHSVFGKVLQHVRHWPALAMLPPEHATAMAEGLPWRSELELWEPWWIATIPTGLRVPRLLALVELPEDRAVAWMEDVQLADAAWDLARYERAAHLLGRWNARCTDPAVLAHCSLPPGYGLRMYTERAVSLRGLGPLQSDELWEHPWLREHGDLRAGLRALAPSISAMLDHLDTLPQCLPHGDASPQNLLVPADGSAELVVIDLSFRTPHALGFDLGQLLVGLTHAGEMPAAELPAIADRIVPAYLAGLGDEGLDADRLEPAVRTGFATSVLLRSGFDALPLETLAQPDVSGALAAACAERLALMRFLLDQYLATVDGVATG